MFEEKTEMISESTYTDNLGFEIREGLDRDQNRVLLTVCGRGSFFSIPDGVYALAEHALCFYSEKRKEDSGLHIRGFSRRNALYRKRERAK